MFFFIGHELKTVNWDVKHQQAKTIFQKFKILDQTEIMIYIESPWWY